MRLLTIGNLYPRPDQLQRGMFNAQLFGALAETDSVENVCLVPEWRVWRWGRVRRWRSPVKGGPPTRYVPVFYLPVVGRGNSHRTYASSLRRSGLASWSAAADAVYVPWIYPDGAATAAALVHDKPLWLMALGSDTLHLEHVSRRGAILAAAHRAQGIICVCRLLADRMINAGVPEEKVHVVPNGVDTMKFHPMPRDEAFDQLRRSGAIADRGLDASATLILFIGNLVPVKGPDVMLRAWAELMTKHAPALAHSHTTILVFIGVGPMRPELVRIARELGVADSVRFAGVRPHEELPLWMNAAAGLCLTSRGEGMPNVVLEALAAGLPVVATDVGACGEMLAGVDGSRVVPADGVNEIAGGLRELLQAPPDTERDPGICRVWHDQAREILELMSGDG